MQRAGMRNVITQNVLGNYISHQFIISLVFKGRPRYYLRNTGPLSVSVDLKDVSSDSLKLTLGLMIPGVLCSQKSTL